VHYHIDKKGKDKSYNIPIFITTTTQKQLRNASHRYTVHHFTRLRYE